MHLDNPSGELEPAALDDTLQSAPPAEVHPDQAKLPASTASALELPEIPPFPTRRDSGDSLLERTGEVLEEDETAPGNEPDEETAVSPKDTDGIDRETVSRADFLPSLRHPKDIRDFNRIVPDGAARLLQLAEGEAQHRHEMERLQVEGQISLERAQLEHQNQANLEVVRGHIERIRGENNVRLLTGTGVHAVAILSFCLAGYLSLKGQVEVAKAIVYAVAVIYISAVLVGSFRNDRRRRRTLPQWPPDMYDDKEEEET